MKFVKNSDAEVHGEVRGSSRPAHGQSANAGSPKLVSTFGPSAQHPHSRAARWLAPAFAACLGAAPLTQSWGREETPTTASVRVPNEDAIAWRSGGIGDDDRDAMRAAAKDYNVHVLFSSRQGSYLADIPFKVQTAAGEDIKTGTSEGPMLYLRLPAGNFKVSAKVDGVWQTRSVRVLAKGNPVSLIFLGRSDAQ